MSKVPHFSRINDAPESLNPVTGRSVYYGMRPWRCDDRFQDWIKSMTFLDPLSVQGNLMRLFYRCAKSDVGGEPLNDYHRLGRREVMYYAERKRSGMMRDAMWERYPYDHGEVKRVVEEDGSKMRVWRHQRALELEAREGKVDEMMYANIFSNAAKEKHKRSS